MNLCTVCGEDFGGVQAFDAHRVGSHAYCFALGRPDGRRCLTAQEMLRKGFLKNSRRRWSLPWSVKLSHESKKRERPGIGVVGDGGE